MLEILKFNDIEVELSQKEIKNVHLRVHPPLGRVTLSAPDSMNKEHLRVYISSKLGWIRRQKRKIISQKREPEYLYITNESHYFFGKRYLLKITESDKKSKIILHHNNIELVVPFGCTVEYKKEKLYKWYRKELRSYLSATIDKYVKIIETSPNSFGIRKVKTKWGSCNDTSKSIWFNIELVKKPKECVDYIVVHELVHLKERRHNKNFIILMNKYLPNWQLRKKTLSELPI